MQCDLLTDKRICKPQIPRPEGKKNLLGNLFSLEVAIQQPLMPKRDSKYQTYAILPGKVPAAWLSFQYK